MYNFYLCIKTIKFSSFKFIKNKVYKSQNFSQQELLMYDDDYDTLSFYIRSKDQIHNTIKLSEHFINIDNSKVPEILFT